MAERDFFDDFGRAFEQFKTVNDERLAAVEKGDTAKVRELDHKLAKIEADVDKFDEMKGELDRERKANDELRTRIEAIEAAGDLPGQSEHQKLSKEYETAFEKWIRSQGQDLGASEQMKEIGRKDVSIGTAAAGGHAMPEVIARQIEVLEYKLSDIVQYVKTVQVGTNDYKELVDIGGMTAAWVGETGTRSPQSTPQLRQVAPTMGELYSYVTASEWSLDDIFFDVENWLSTSAATQFALAVSQSIWDGNGTNQPTGMTNTAPVTTDDWASPLRAAAAYEYIASAASPDALTADSIHDVVGAVNRVYLPNARFAANRTTWSVIRKLADTTNQYLWQPGLALGQPNTLVGYPTFVWENMDSVGANADVVAFGDFAQGYVRAVRRETRITVDNVTAAGFVKFYIRRREGGIPLNNDAVKFIRTT